MNFELHITCTKDIDEIHINFSDGTSVIKSKEEKNNAVCDNSNLTSTISDQKNNSRETFLDTEADFDTSSKEVVKPPVIERSERPVNVAAELQDLDL